MDEVRGKRLTPVMERLRDFFIPTFDELSVFLMAVVWLALVVTDQELRTELQEWWGRLDTAGSRGDGGVFVLVGIFLAGLVLSLFHVFVRREKGAFSKGFMSAFALILTGASGVAAGAHMLQSSPGVLLIFPVWNIINGLVALWYMGLADSSRFSDTDATPGQVGVGMMSAGIVFIVCHSILHWHWSVTLSLCVAYATNVNCVVQKLVGARLPK